MRPPWIHNWSGGVIYKGFNRIAGTLLAGSIAIGIHSIAVKSGEKVEQGVFVFVIGKYVFLFLYTN